jgi:hypothetical protein
MTFYRSADRIDSRFSSDLAMHPASYRQSSYLQPASLRSRAVAASLAAGITVLIILMLMTVSALGPRRPDTKPLIVTFQLRPPPPPARARTVVKVENSSHAAAAPHPAKVPPLNMVMLTRKDFAASDIAALTPHQASGARGADSGTDTGTSDGPGGEKLYDVDWYTKPTRAELAPYMPASMPATGWATIMCRMIDHYHVEDCRELGESPAGSGLSRGLRQAAWQFRVRPPRIGDRPIIGGWVRIRFEFTESASADN